MTEPSNRGSNQTRGYIGTHDYMCDTSGNCPGYFDWTVPYFTGNTYFDFPYYGQAYRAGNNGTLVFTLTGSGWVVSGDITGN